MNARRAGFVIIVGSLVALAVGLSGTTALQIERGRQLGAVLLLNVGSLAHGLRRIAAPQRRPDFS